MMDGLISKLPESEEKLRYLQQSQTLKFESGKRFPIKVQRSIPMHIQDQFFRSRHGTQNLENMQPLETEQGHNYFFCIDGKTL